MQKQNPETYEAGRLSSQIASICGVVDVGSRHQQSLYLGWTDHGLPMVTDNERFLTKQAISSVKLTRAALKDGQDVGVEIPYGSVEAMQYRRFVRVADFLDEGTRLTQDIIVFEVNDALGQSRELQIREGDFLLSLLRSHLRWQVYNEKTLMSQDQSTPALPMHTVFFPDALEHKSYALMFKARMDNESNEPAFKLFLRRCLEALVLLDSEKLPEEQKGYVEALERHMGKKQNQPGLAYHLIKFISDNFYRLEPGDVEAVRRDSVDRGLAAQAGILLREFGFLDSEALRRYSTVDAGDIDSMELKDLLGNKDKEDYGLVGDMCKVVFSKLR